MLQKIAATALIIVTIASFLIVRQADAQTNLDNFKVLVLVVPSKNFTSKYKYTYTTDKYKGGRRAYWIQDDLIEALEDTLGSRGTGGLWRVDILKDREEFKKKAARADAYLSVNVVIDGMKYTSKSSLYKYRSYRELTVDCEVYRKSGTIWSGVYRKRLTTKSSTSDDDEYYISSVERMADTLDAITIDCMVPHKVVNALAKDSKTKIINVTVNNPTPFAIKRLKWMVPLENDRVFVETKDLIKPGETQNLRLIARSDRSHASLRWRDTVVSEVEFTKTEN